MPAKPRFAETIKSTLNLDTFNRYDGRVNTDVIPQVPASII